jgi:uncharacterized membrane protein YukC
VTQRRDDGAALLVAERRDRTEQHGVDSFGLIIVAVLLLAWFTSWVFARLPRTTAVSAPRS